MIADGRRAFIGSQSLKRLELDNRREVGILLRERRIVKQLEAVFAEDWAHSCKGAAEPGELAHKPPLVAEAAQLVTAG
jgi:hypothetical protein